MSAIIQDELFPLNTGSFSSLNSNLGARDNYHNRYVTTESRLFFDDPPYSTDVDSVAFIDPTTSGGGHFSAYNNYLVSNFRGCGVTQLPTKGSTVRSNRTTNLGWSYYYDFDGSVIKVISDDNTFTDHTVTSQVKIGRSNVVLNTTTTTLEIPNNYVGCSGFFFICNQGLVTLTIGVLTSSVGFINTVTVVAGQAKRFYLNANGTIN